MNFKKLLSAGFVLGLVFSGGLQAMAPKLDPETAETMNNGFKELQDAQNRENANQEVQNKFQQIKNDNHAQDVKSHQQDEYNKQLKTVINGYFSSAKSNLNVANTKVNAHKAAKHIGLWDTLRVGLGGVAGIFGGLTSWMGLTLAHDAVNDNGLCAKKMIGTGVFAVMTGLFGWLAKKTNDQYHVGMNGLEETVKKPLQSVYNSMQKIVDAKESFMADEKNNTLVLAQVIKNTRGLCGAVQPRNYFSFKKTMPQWLSNDTHLYYGLSGDLMIGDGKKIKTEKEYRTALRDPQGEELYDELQVPTPLELEKDK